MNTVETLRGLPALFPYNDAAKFTQNANVFLTRALSKGVIARVCRGVYHNSLFHPRPGIEEVGCFVKSPSYVSCEWAMNAHGVILQVPSVCTVLTLAPNSGARDKIAWDGAVLEFSRISPRLFYGYKNAGGFNLASPEKALLDAVYMRGAIPFADELEMDRLDTAKLAELAASFPLTVRRKISNLTGMTPKGLR